MHRARRVLLIALSLGALLSCTGTKGEECDVCATDADCKGGFVCSNFSDGSRRCGTGNPQAPTQCRVQ